MAKKTRRPKPGASVDLTAEVPVVGMREPCPCGSGKRYKLCHGRAAREERVLPPARPFEGLAGERDWVALRSFVPAATAPLRLQAPHADRAVLLCTVLPLAMPAQVQTDGAVWLATQTQDPGSGDPSRDLAAALLAALETDPGEPVEPPAATLDGPRLQDVLDVTVAPEVDVREGVDFWAEDAEGGASPDLAAGIEQVNEAVEPTVRLDAVEAAYWVRSGARTHLRWVLAHDEERLLDGLARLHAAGESALVEGGRLIGSFRACGLSIPVWELPSDTTAEALETPAKAFEAQLDEAIATTAALSVDERGARAGLLSRQVTVR